MDTSIYKESMIYIKSLRKHHEIELRNAESDGVAS